MWFFWIRSYFHVSFSLFSVLRCSLPCFLSNIQSCTYRKRSRPISSIFCCFECL
ncbi:hypothetical protein BDQ12DRAFT_683601 [Crucibulum laeve]|uniref:Uncharacterized protein n=1 Tax=Crucibulum laeve TaxID=68775 RepID=A0A5C3M0V4_9AGAR|nr:hypothetical protein BDQ12DRAFT_683601 [Crucibulum laeve]